MIYRFTLALAGTLAAFAVGLLAASVLNQIF